MRILFHSKMAAAALAAVCIVAANAAADAETTLLNETFDREPAGVALEDAAQSQWSAVEGQLAIGGGRALVGQALGYAKGNTWKYQIYDRPLSATLGQGEAFDLSFASAVRTTASPEFYIYAVRLYAGDDFIELSFKGGKDKPVVKAAVHRAQQTHEASAAAEYYATAPDAGLAAVRMVTNDNRTLLYCRDKKDGPWRQIGEAVGHGLGEVDKVRLRYYAVGFWSAMDDIKLSIIDAPAD